MDTYTDPQSNNSGDENASIKKTEKIEKPLIVLVLIALFVGGVYVAYKNFIPRETPPAKGTATFFEPKYYGVFLDTNDVYFGKLSNKDSASVTLDDAFYLKVTQTSQKTKDGKVVNVPNINLVKLGMEIYKPKGTIEIQRNHIVSLQELAPDSEVIKIMKNHQTPAQL